MTATGIIFIACGVIAFKIPARVYRLAQSAWHMYRIKTMFHYIEYSYRGNKYHTRRSGPLNDLEGTGLAMEVKSRGGKVDIHIQGTRDFVQAYINTRADEIADWRGQTYNN
ncbi:hypothetical protein pEaSNUABM55_00212 [Erwinia phage pEa_SNUABM_55]|nr:hypothetical protein pEaSNUABM55_00212 [Erwinia phage pEa_SNUABM_55]